MMRLLNKITDMLADVALEKWVFIRPGIAKERREQKTLEENLIEVAFAEAADFDDIHKAILREDRSERDIAHPDGCQYGDNNMFFV